MTQDPKIAQAVTPVPASKIKTELALTTVGVVLPATMAEVTSLAQYMAKCDKAIPAFMRNNPGECMSVIMDGINWQMNPFALARQRYVVNDIGAYMSQVIAAVVKSRAPIVERVINPTYTGDGQALKCSFKLHHRETGEEITYESPPIGEIKVQNSPLWKTEPRQQLYYYSMRAMARRHFPDVLLGAYDVEEAHAMRDVTPKQPVENALDDGDEAPVHVHQGEVIEPERKEAQREPAEEATTYDPETGEITGISEEEAERMRQGEHIDRGEPDEEGQTGLGLTEPAELTPDHIYTNLVKGCKACLTAKDYGAWRVDNMTAETRKQIGGDRWKALGKIMAEVEERVGWL